MKRHSRYRGLILDAFELVKTQEAVSPYQRANLPGANFHRDDRVPLKLC